MASEPVLVFASFQPYPAEAAALRATLDTMVEHTRQEPGNQVYDLYESGEDRVSYHLFERYTDSDALEAHRASAHYKDYRARLPDLLEHPIEVVVLREVDVAG